MEGWRERPVEKGEGVKKREGREKESERARINDSSHSKHTPCGEGFKRKRACAGRVDGLFSLAAEEKL